MRPEPRPTVLSESFWTAASRGELLLPRCRACGTGHFPPQAICPNCRSVDLGWERSAGEGSIYSVTIVHRKPVEGFDVPFALALIELEEGWTLMSHVVGVPIDKIWIGMPVRVRFDRVGQLDVPVFVSR